MLFLLRLWTLNCFPKLDLLICSTGLNQVALCEESGFENFTEINWDCDAQPPVSIAAGNGTSFIVTSRGKVASFGNGKYGVLGHGGEESDQIPRVIRSLEKVFVSKVAVGHWHCMALTDEGQLYRYVSVDNVAVVFVFDLVRLLEGSKSGQHSFSIRTLPSSIDPSSNSLK